MEEKWAPIKKFEGYYEVSNLGRVRSLDRKMIIKGNGGGYYEGIRRGKILKQRDSNVGYLRVYLSSVKNGISRSYSVHRLVAEAFIPGGGKRKQVNHKDENKHNNIADNLEWCTAKYNSSYGTRPLRLSTAVVQMAKEGDYLRYFPSVSKAAEFIGVHYTTISHAMKDGRAVKGFYWKRA